MYIRFFSFSYTNHKRDIIPQQKKLWLTTVRSQRQDYSTNIPYKVADHIIYQSCNICINILVFCSTRARHTNGHNTQQCSWSKIGQSLIKTISFALLFLSMTSTHVCMHVKNSTHISSCVHIDITAKNRVEMIIRKFRRGSWSNMDDLLNTFLNIKFHPHI